MIFRKREEAFLNKKVLVLLAICCTLRADTIEIINHTKKPLFVGLYEIKADLLGKSTGDAKLISSLAKVLPEDVGQKATLQRPLPRLRMNLMLLFSETREKLLPELSIEEYRQMARIPANWLYLSPFHIIEKMGVLRGYDTTQWKTSFLRSKTKQIKESILDRFTKSKKYTYTSLAADVRIGKDLAKKEVSAINRRADKAHVALEKLLGRKLDLNAMPRIAVVMSGGGMRAATCAYALFAGLHDIGLLDAVLYAAALSGSTWFLSHYLMAGLPLEDYEEQFMKAITESHLLSTTAVTSSLWQKFIFDQPIGMIDIYGVFIANTFFRYLDNDLARQRLRFSALEGQLQRGDWVFPLCTAIETTFGYNWFTFTPYEIGSETTDAFIPTWSFGRKFSKGKSIDRAPEQSVGFFMGFWGSAVSGSVYQMLKASEAELSPMFGRILEESLVESGVGRQQIVPIKIFNPFYGSNVITYKNQSKLTFLDAGYAFNLPFPPVLNRKRNIDVIIAMDASVDVHQGANELKKAERYAREKHYPFPPVDYKAITQKPVSIFRDDHNPGCPILIYIVPQVNKNNPCLKKALDKKKSCSMANLFATIYPTGKFTYKAEDVEWLVKTIRLTINDYRDDMVKAIKQKAAKKEVVLKKRRPT
jgi:cytosolic phospholipase A2